MKNTEATFYSLKQFEYLPLNVRSIRDSAEVFCLFSMYLKDKAFKYLKKQNIIWQFGVKFHMYPDTGGDDDDNYERTLWRHCEIRKGSEKHMGNVPEKLCTF